MDIAITICHKVIVSIKSCQWYSDEIDQVIACESHSKGECTQEYNEFEHWHFQRTEHCHNHREDHKATSKDSPGIIIDEFFQFWSHDAGTLQTIDEQEPDDACHRNTSENANL